MTKVRICETIVIVFDEQWNIYFEDDSRKQIRFVAHVHKIFFGFFGKKLAKVIEPVYFCEINFL